MGKPQAAAGADNGQGLERQQKIGLSIPRYFTQVGVNPFDEVQWETRHALITGEGGSVVFEQHDAEFPSVLVSIGNQRGCL